VRRYRLIYLLPKPGVSIRFAGIFDYKLPAIKGGALHFCLFIIQYVISIKNIFIKENIFDTSTEATRRGNRMPWTVELQQCPFSISIKPLPEATA
jgi:hypothetical protein